MALYRLYAPQKDEWGCTVTCRVGRVYCDVKKAVAAARRVSKRYGVAEIHDEARSIYDRMIAVFRDGREVQNRFSIS